MVRETETLPCQAAAAPCHLGLPLEEPEGTGFQTEPSTDPIAGGWVAGQDDGTAGGIAVQRRGGAPQDLDPSDRAELKIGELALAVWCGLRDAVEQDLDPAGAERRSAAETADGEPLVERVIVAIGDIDAGDGIERLVEPQGGLRTLDLAAVHHGGGSRHPTEALGGAGDSDGDVSEPSGAGGVGPKGVGELGRLGQGSGDKRQNQHAAKDMAMVTKGDLPDGRPAPTRFAAR